MKKSISKDYLLFAMDETGKLLEKKPTICFLVSCLMELLLDDITYIENENLYIKDKLSKEDYHLLPMYNTIKYSAAMKPNELLVCIKLNELFDGVKEALIKEGKTIEKTELKIFSKDKINIIAKDTEINNIIQNIKQLINNNSAFDNETLILVELLLKSNLIQDHLSLDELNYIKNESEIIKNNQVNHIYTGTEKSFNFYTLMLLLEPLVWL